MVAAASPSITASTPDDPIAWPVLRVAAAATTALSRGFSCRITRRRRRLPSSCRAERRGDPSGPVAFPSPGKEAPQPSLLRFIGSVCSNPCSKFRFFLRFLARKGLSRPITANESTRREFMILPPPGFVFYFFCTHSVWTYKFLGLRERGGYPARPCFLLALALFCLVFND